MKTFMRSKSLLGLVGIGIVAASGFGCTAATEPTVVHSVALAASEEARALGIDGYNQIPCDQEQCFELVMTDQEFRPQLLLAVDGARLEFEDKTIDLNLRRLDETYEVSFGENGVLLGAVVYDRSNPQQAKAYLELLTDLPGAAMLLSAVSDVGGSRRLQSVVVGDDVVGQVQPLLGTALCLYYCTSCVKGGDAKAKSCETCLSWVCKYAF